MVKIEFDFQFRENGMIKSPFKRVKVNAYRGVQADGSGTGMAMYTQGFYSTTSRKYASQYGTVSKVPYEMLPVLPLRVRNADWFNYLVNQVIRPQFEAQTGKKFDFDYVKPILQGMGYDGLVIGDLREAIIVTW